MTLGHANNDATTAIGAWYVERRRFLAGLELRRLQLLGQSTWTLDASPGEDAAILSTATDQAAATAVAEAILDRTLADEWDDFRLAYAHESGALSAAVVRWARRHGLAALWMPAGCDYVVDTLGDERAYVGALSDNARRAYFGKRRVASARGLVYSEGSHATEATLETLFALHDARWKGAGLAPRQKTFLRRLAARWGEDVQLRVSTLDAGGEAVSASLNVDARGVTYNLQGGFRADWEPRVSLGKLHLGHEISRAFGTPSVHAFDLLPGVGQRVDYKAQIATRRLPVRTLWVLRTRRSRALLGAARWRDRVLSGNGPPVWRVAE